MGAPRLEHANLTVSDALATARMFENIFGWHIRWQGDAIHGGFTVHVGENETYLALYSQTTPARDGGSSFNRLLGLNHLGVVVDDLDAIEARVVEQGYEPCSHADYEPGRRFYFEAADGLEIEVVSYVSQ